MNPLTLLSQLPVWGQHLVVVAGAIVSILTAVSVILRVLALIPRFSALKGWAEWVDHGAFAIVGLLQQVQRARAAAVLKAALKASPLALLALVFGCSFWTPAKEAAAARLGIDAGECAINAWESNPKITPEELAIACLPGAAADLWRVVVAHKRAVAIGVVASAGPCASGKP